MMELYKLRRFFCVLYVCFASSFGVCILDYIQYTVFIDVYVLKFILCLFYVFHTVDGVEKSS